tara:strand:- start:42 stop:1295 length:1254 start_codon:yes stop_codon:yes gene_type:complete
MIKLYKFLGFILIPLIKINLFFRLIKKKEVKDRIKERFGISSTKRPEKDLVWIHAASVGEFKSSGLLIDLLYKDYTVLVTTTTLSSANFAKKNYSQKIIHQFAPLDISHWVERFLDKWNPKLILWIESDLWPITMQTINQRSIPALLLNVRMSPQSFNKWQNLKFFYKQMTDSFSEICAQSEIDKKRIEKLTNRKIKFIGNMKLSVTSEIDNKNAENKLQIFHQNKTLMLSSTHYDEESQFLPIVKNLLKQIIGLKIIIAPRHPERSTLIRKNYIKEGISANLLNESNSFAEDVFIINSFGNLPTYFAASDVVFLGGSFVDKGGHNPIEPAKNDCIIITGPSIYNWQNIYEYMIKNEACIVFDELYKLENYIINLFNADEKRMLEIKKITRKISEKNFFDTKSLIKIISNKIKVSSC